MRVSALLLIGTATALRVGMPVRVPHTIASPRAAHAIMQAPQVDEEVVAAPTEAPSAVVPAVKYTPEEVRELPNVKAMLQANPSLADVIRRAEFWTNETATVLELINVIGRFECTDDFKTRTTFTEAGYRDEDLRQAGTEKRYMMAQKLGCVERIALSMNAPNLPFTNEKLAASVGLTVADFESIPVTDDACNVAYDALAESRSGLIPFAVADQRRKEWINELDSSFNKPRFMIGLAKSRFLVIIAWFVFGKGNFVWVLVFAQALHDIRPDLFPTPKELGLDKIGFFF